MNDILDNIKSEPIHQEELEQNEDVEPNCDIEPHNYEVLNSDPLKFEKELTSVKEESFDEQCDFEPEEDVESDCDIELGKYEVYGHEWIKVEGAVCDATEPSDSNKECCVLCGTSCDAAESMVCRSCKANCDVAENVKALDVASHKLNSCAEEVNNDEMERGGGVTSEDSSFVIFKCSVCPFVSGLSGALEAHMDTHTVIDRLKPSGDGIIVREETKHLAAIVNGRTTFCCQTCPYKTRISSNMRKHLRIHTGYKPFKCTVCSYSCSQAGNLKMHMRTHTGHKPFRCPHCLYSSSQAGNLKAHMATHTCVCSFSSSQYRTSISDQ